MFPRRQPDDLKSLRNSPDDIKRLSTYRTGRTENRNSFYGVSHCPTILQQIEA